MYRCVCVTLKYAHLEVAFGQLVEDARRLQGRAWQEQSLLQAGGEIMFKLIAYVESTIKSHKHLNYNLI